MLEENHDEIIDIIDQGSTTKNIINLFASKASGFLIFFVGVITLPILYFFIKIVYIVTYPNNCGAQEDPTNEYICNFINSILGAVWVLILVPISIILFWYLGQRFINRLYRNQMLWDEEPDIQYKVSNDTLTITGYKKEIKVNLLDSQVVELHAFKIIKPNVKGYLICLNDYDKFKDIIKIVGSSCLFLPSKNNLQIDITFDTISHLKNSFYKKDGLLHLIKKS